MNVQKVLQQETGGDRVERNTEVIVSKSVHPPITIDLSLSDEMLGYALTMYVVDRMQ